MTGLPPMLIPAGTIIAYSGKIAQVTHPLTPPGGIPGTIDNGVLEASGWMVCDGRQLDAIKYPSLFYAIGYTYNKDGKAPGTEEYVTDLTGIKFYIPDYRGYFLRGTDTGGINDPDTASRYELYNKTPGANVGSIQLDAFQQHKHLNVIVSDETGQKVGAQAPTPLSIKVADTGDPDKNAEKAKINADETRPLNMYVHYLVRIW